MQTTFLVKISEFCFHHNLEESFIVTIESYDLIELIVMDDSKYIHQDHLPKLEKIIRLHNELGINIEGIGAVLQLTDKIIEMQNEVVVLKNLLQNK